MLFWRAPDGYRNISKGLSAGSDSLAGGCSPRVERGGQEALAEVLDHPSSKDAEKLMETVVKASSPGALTCRSCLYADHHQYYWISPDRNLL